MDFPRPIPSRAPSRDPRRPCGLSGGRRWTQCRAARLAMGAAGAPCPSPGTARRAHRRGLTDFPERFHQRRRLYLIPPERVGTRPREMELENFWFLRSRIILKFRGIDSINEAEAIRGYTVAIPAEDRAPLEAGFGLCRRPDRLPASST